MKRADAHEASCIATREAELRSTKRAFGSRRTKPRALLHASAASASWRCAPLHIREANASLTKPWIYVILNLKDGDITSCKNPSAIVIEILFWKNCNEFRNTP